jgi:thiosulfate/3-mercaptopyruvate sulfurtransferase
MPFGPLVPAAWLADHLGDPDVRIADIRWSLDRGPERDAYLAGHIPGAVFVDLDTDLAAPHGQGPGRHALPSRASFQDAMRRAGIDRGSRVVAYAVAVLDGGIQAWDGPLERGPGPAEGRRGDFQAAERDPSGTTDYEQLRQQGPEILLDARSPDRYTGEHEPVDPRAGHIPGARNAFWKDNLDPSGRFRPPEELRERYRELGVASGQEVVAYCGSGVTSCHDLLALELAGLAGGRLYPGSWSDWSSRPEAPVATGTG